MPLKPVIGGIGLVDVPSVPSPVSNNDKFLQSDGSSLVYTPSVPDSGLGNIVEDATPQLGGNLDLNTHVITGLSSADSPQFTAVNIGAATDTTVSRASAGDIAVEGNIVYRAAGTDVPVTDGGTGRSTGTTAYAIVATGTTATGAQQTLASGATTEVLVGGGAAALPVWTTASGSGAPVRATSPTLVTPALGTPSSGTLTSCTGLPVSGITASTSTALGVGTVELGHASDTTLSRVSAGVAAIEGVNILTTAAISDTVYGAGWDADTTHAPSKNAVYDKIEAIVLSGGGGITDVVQDTTPQLGGNLDLNGHNLNAVTPTEIGYVSGVTSAIQTQLGAKVTASGGSVAACVIDASGFTGNLAVTDNTMQEVANALDALSAVSDIVEDTTPQLGGNLDLNGHVITGLSSADSPEFTAVNIGHPTDTTVARVSAGKISVEGVNVVTISSSDVLTNKTLTSPTLTTPVLGTPSSGTLTSCTGLPISGLVASTSLALGVGTIELGAASDTTIARSGAGDISVEGNAVYRASGTDVPVADGGTGRSTGTTAYALVATGTTATGAQQTLASGATTEVLVGGGASALPVWTTASGSGAPVRATSPVLVTPALGTPSSGTLTSCTGLPVSGITASTATALGVGSVELGHASDTTLTRVSAGVMAVEGVNVLTTAAISDTVYGAGWDADTTHAASKNAVYDKIEALSLSVGIANVVEDLTPQLGGDLDANGNDITGIGTIDVTNLTFAAIAPTTDDGAALGNTTHNFSDLFLATGATVNVQNGNWIATHSSGILTVGTGDLRVTTAGTNSASAVTVGGSQTLTNKTLTAPVLTSGTVTTKISPTTDDGAPLGDLTHNFSDLFLASGGVINIANSDWVATHTTGILTVGTGDLRVTTAGTNSASAVTVGGTQSLTNKKLGSLTSNGFVKTGSGDGTLSVDTATYYSSGGTDVTVADGGTGRSTSTTAYGLIAAGTTATGAHQTLAAGATTEILVGGGASALPAWTTATGSGAPMRGTSPDVTTSITTGSTTFAIANTTATTVNAFGGASTAINMGHASGTNTILGITKAKNFLSTKIQSGAYTVGTTDANEPWGGIVYAGSTGTISLPAVVAGMSVTVIADAASVITVDPNGSEQIRLEGSTLAAGFAVKSAAAIGEVAVFSYYSAGIWFCSSATFITNGS